MPETPTPPDDLIDLKARWFAAQAEHKRACDEENAGPEITTPVRESVYAVSPVEKWVRKLPLREPTAEQLERRAKAYDRLMQLTLELADHEWLAKLQFGTRLDAEAHVNRLAFKRYEEQALATA